MTIGQAQTGGANRVINITSTRVRAPQVVAA
ncbi:MAG: hypothetical protein QOI55_3023 [Actinomycetota bacterium]|nr:hypothetical protein [Actinomycetota bacterium]